MFCRQCGTKLEEGAKFCVNCGAPVGQAESKRAVDDSFTDNGEQKEAVEYPIVAICPDAKSYALICAIAVVGLIVAGLWLGRMFGFGIRWTFRTFAFLAGLATVKYLMLIGKKQYVIPCPHCGHEFGFPVQALGAQCPKCNKRIIIVNGKTHCANND